MKYLLGMIWLLIAFFSGVRFQEYMHGSVTLETFVDDGTDLNHGQQSLEIKFPYGVRVDQMRLPGGSLWPDDEHKPRWVEIGPDGPKLWIDRFDVDIVGSGRAVHTQAATR